MKICKALQKNNIMKLEGEWVEVGNVKQSKVAKAKKANALCPFSHHRDASSKSGCLTWSFVCLTGVQVRKPEIHLSSKRVTG